MDDDTPAHAKPDPALDPKGSTPHGVPEDAGEAEPKGYPTSDRHHSEVKPVTPA